MTAHYDRVEARPVIGPVCNGWRHGLTLMYFMMAPSLFQAFVCYHPPLEFVAGFAIAGVTYCALARVVEQAYDKYLQCAGARDSLVLVHIRPPEPAILMYQYQYQFTYPRPGETG